MILYPAIDLKDGACVRLLHGDMARATVFNASPTDQAAAFERAGFQWLHVVDLNGAIEGRSANGEAVRAILGAVTVPVQLGGGVRTRAAIDAWVEAGVARVIVGTAAVRDPAMVRAAAAANPGRVALGIDVRDGRVAVEGWVETSTIDPLDLARQFEDAGVAALIVTDISRDGALTGVNVDAVGAIADAVDIPVIASGGVASLDDITLLKARAGRPVAGAILGRALYTGAITPADALRLAA
jgi:phosphoribosylformimino-5-aminoimidazole carboxamide ribotide isomerase